LAADIRPNKRCPPSTWNPGKESGYVVWVKNTKAQDKPGLRAKYDRQSGVHRIEEIAVGLGLLQLIDQELNRIGRSHRGKDTAQNEDLLQILTRH